MLYDKLEAGLPGVGETVGTTGVGEEAAGVGEEAAGVAFGSAP
jgi:hypothetical protein